MTTGARILIVEDHAPNLMLMEHLLRAFGHTTFSAQDGVEAVSRAKEISPDLILMDLQMPNMDGFEAARQIRALPALAGVPIIAVTASAMVGDRDKILARGFDGYVAKPITPETFVYQIEAFLPKKGPPGGRVA